MFSGTICRIRCTRCSFTTFLLIVMGLAGSVFSQSSLEIQSGKTIETRFRLPMGFSRVVVDSASFGTYLRRLPLKPTGSAVRYFDGKQKTNPNIYLAVVAMEIGKRDLQQCADAVMRLKAEYHYARKEYGKIHFNFLSDGKSHSFISYAKGDHSHPKFTKYLDYIFSSANTRSLFDELKPVRDFSKLQLGDILIQKGNPYGHAVIVVDLAHNPKTGQTVFQLAQSYMPAQETQILANPSAREVSPWYLVETRTGAMSARPSTDFSIPTPEWDFNQGDLRRFAE